MTQIIPGDLDSIYLRKGRVFEPVGHAKICRTSEYTTSLGRQEVYTGILEGNRPGFHMEQCIATESDLLARSKNRSSIALNYPMDMYSPKSASRYLRGQGQYCQYWSTQNPSDNQRPYYTRSCNNPVDPLLTRCTVNTRRLRLRRTAGFGHRPGDQRHPLDIARCRRSVGTHWRHHYWFE